MCGELFASLPDVADFVERILKSAKLADVHMPQATRFYIVVNMKKAPEIGVKISQSLLPRADDVIQ